MGAPIWGEEGLVSPNQLQRVCAAMKGFIGIKGKQAQTIIEVVGHILHHPPLHTDLLTSPDLSLDALLSA